MLLEHVFFIYYVAILIYCFIRHLFSDNLMLILIHQLFVNSYFVTTLFLSFTHLMILLFLADLSDFKSSSWDIAQC